MDGLSVDGLPRSSGRSLGRGSVSLTRSNPDNMGHPDSSQWLSLQAEGTSSQESKRRLEPEMQLPLVWCVDAVSAFKETSRCVSTRRC